VNQVLERAMEASIGRPIYGDAEWHRVYHEDEKHVYREAPTPTTAVRRCWLLGARHPAQRRCSSRRWSSPGRSGGRLS
jgi:hypothetical protein